MEITFAAAVRRCLVPLVVLVAGCSRPGPGTDDLKMAISQTAPGMTVTDIKCESYANESQEGLGRSSCKGTLSLDEDQYESLAPNDLAGLLVEAGIPQTGAGFFLQRHPQQVFTPAAAKGAEAAFSSECSYEKVVDSWNLGCNTTYQRFAGQPPASIGQGAVIKGSPEYRAWIGQVTSDYRQMDAAYRAVELKVKAFFAVGRTIELRDKSTGRTWYRARITSPLSWGGDPGVLGRQGSFSTIAKYQDLRERTNQTLCGYPRGQPMDDLLLSGGIGFGTNPSQGTFNPQVSVVERNGMFGNSFTGCGNTFPWNGVSFGSQLNNALELVSH